MDAVKLIEAYNERDDVFMFLDPPYISDDFTDETSKQSKNADRFMSAGFIIPIFCR